MNQTIRFIKLRPDAIAPKYAHDGDAGLDLHACFELMAGYEGLDVQVGDPPVLIDTGIAIELPRGFQAEVRPRSGWSKRGLWVPVGTIDCTYRGSIGVIVSSVHGCHVVKPGDRIAQLVISRVETVTLIESAGLSQTARGSRGFGSTGTGVDT